MADEDGHAGIVKLLLGEKESTSKPEMQRMAKRGCPRPVLRTAQSVSLGSSTGQTAGGSQSFFESMDGLGQMEVGPVVFFCCISLASMLRNTATQLRHENNFAEKGWPKLFMI